MYPLLFASRTEVLVVRAAISGGQRENPPPFLFLQETNGWQSKNKIPILSLHTYWRRTGQRQCLLRTRFSFLFYPLMSPARPLLLSTLGGLCLYFCVEKEQKAANGTGVTREGRSGWRGGN